MKIARESEAPALAVPKSNCFFFLSFRLPLPGLALRPEPCGFPLSANTHATNAAHAAPPHMAVTTLARQPRDRTWAWALRSSNASGRCGLHGSILNPHSLDRERKDVPLSHCP